MNVYVIDAIMGAGKSTFAIKTINDNFWERYLIVVPFLSEITRYKNSIRHCDVVEPRNWGKSKSKHLKELISKGKNIITTHQLITRLDEETINLLKKYCYNLLLDESLEVIKQYPITHSDLTVLINGGYLYETSDHCLKWNYSNIDASRYNGTYFSNMKYLCDLNALMPCKNASDEISSLIWNFPPEFFKVFKTAFIFTYLWNGSFQKAYFDVHGIEYSIHSLYKGKLIDYSVEAERGIKKKYQKLITIIEDDKLNAMGNPVGWEKPFSNSWFKRLDQDDVKKIKDDLYNFFRHRVGGGAKYNMWSTYKQFEPLLKGKGYSGTAKNQCFVPFNVRGTNEFAHKKNLAYLVNVYPEPEIPRFFNQCGIQLDSDAYALSCMVQWVWRSQIRQGKPITLYVPSNRMRNIFKKWLTE